MGGSEKLFGKRRVKRSGDGSNEVKPDRLEERKGESTETE